MGFRSHANVARDALGVDEWLSPTHKFGGADEPMRMAPSENRRQKVITPRLLQGPLVRANEWNVRGNVK
jgi:hypothetical protein